MSVYLKEIVVLLVALLAGVGSAASLDRWHAGLERGSVETVGAKEELLASADLRKLHHRIYEAVGERAWEERVKPDFLMAITAATVRETGDLFPDWRDVVGWVRRHPEEARRYLEGAAGIRK